VTRKNVGPLIESAVANMLRVMRGAGRPYQIIGDIEDIAEELRKTWNDTGERCAAVGEINTALFSWTPKSEEGRTDYFERCVCDAALRMVASLMEGNHTERSKASHDIWQCFSSWETSKNETLRREQDEYLKEKADSYAKRYRRANAIDRINTKVLSAANDNAECYVYFVTDGEAIKIGKAHNPKKRLSGLQTSHYKPLRFLAILPGGYEYESHLHSLFRGKHIRGEWFEDCKEIRDYIKMMTANEAAPRLSAANDNGTNSQSDAA
jgi:hypothetical protein